MKKKNYSLRCGLITGMLMAFIFTQAENLNWVNAYIGTGANTSYGSIISIKQCPDSTIVAVIPFSDTIDIDPTAGVNNVVASSFSDILVAKFSPSGQLLWHFKIGTPNMSYYTNFSCFAIAANGDIYLAGNIGSVTDFDPSANDASLTPSGGYNPFIAVYGANGNYINAHLLNTTGTGTINSIAINTHGNIFIAGDFSGSIDLDPSPINEILSSLFGGTDGFLASYTPGLTFISDYQIPTQCGCTESFLSIVIDGSDNVYTSGNYQSGTSVVNTGAFGLQTVNPGHDQDIFIASFDSTFLLKQAVSIGSPQDDYSYYLAYSPAGARLYLGAGSNGSGFDADPSAGNLIVVDPNLATPSYWMVNSYNTSDLSVNWAKPFDASAGLVINQLVTAADGVNVVMGIKGTIDLDPNAGIVNVNYANNNGVLLNIGAGGAYNHHFAYEGLGATDILSFANVIETPDYYYLTGVHRGTIDFDFNSGTKTITTSSTQSDAHIMRVDRYAVLPTTNATSLTFSNGTDSTVDVNFPGGDGEGRVLFVKEDSAENFIPVATNNYVSIFHWYGYYQIGTPSINYYLYQDTGHVVSVSALDAAHHNYQFAVYQYNYTTGATNYLTTNPTRGTYTTMSTGVKNMSEEIFSFSIYPNPANTILNVELRNTNEESTIKITDLNGRILSETKTHTAFEKINLDEFSSGVYFITVKSKEGNSTKKFICSK